MLQNCSQPTAFAYPITPSSPNSVDQPIATVDSLVEAAALAIANPLFDTQHFGTTPTRSQNAPANTMPYRTELKRPDLKGEHRDAWRFRWSAVNFLAAMRRTSADLTFPISRQLPLLGVRQDVLPQFVPVAPPHAGALQVLPVPDVSHGDHK